MEMREIKIGVEIEFFGVCHLDVVAELNRQGITCSFEGYTHQVMRTWKLVTDASVNNEGTGLSRGLELVSPILYGDEGLDELEQVLAVLNSLGAKVDRTCGIHLHHDVADYTAANFISLHNLYYSYQEGINSILPKSRRTSSRNTYCKGLNFSDLSICQNAPSIKAIANEIYSRYFVLNSQSYIKYGTIEFRQHSGSIDFQKIEAWVVLTHTMVNYAKYNQVELSDDTGSLERLLTMLNMDDSHVGEFYKARKAALAC